MKDKLTSENPLWETRMMRAATESASQHREHPGGNCVTRLLDEFVHDNCHWAVQEFCEQGAPVSSRAMKSS